MKILILAAMLATTAPAMASEAFKPEDIYSLSMVTNPVLAQDGKRVLFTRAAFDRGTDRRTGELWLAHLDEQGRIIDKRLLVARDVTKMLRLEHMRRDFVANVSHELRTPLTVIHGYLDMLDPTDFPEWTPILAEMQKQSQRMTQLVEDLLTLSRLEAQESLAEESVSMAPMLATLKREAEALSQHRHTLIVQDEAHCDLWGSNKELHSAFSNLVSNAVRYTPIDGTITVRFARDEGGGAVLSVRDTGYGIPLSHLPRITERFYRVSTSRSRESGGTGLGLSIVKHVLNLHQARLEIESEVGQGSTFSIHFTPERVSLRDAALPRIPTQSLSA